MKAQSSVLPAKATWHIQGSGGRGSSNNWHISWTRTSAALEQAGKAAGKKAKVVSSCHRSLDLMTRGPAVHSWRSKAVDVFRQVPDLWLVFWNFHLNSYSRSLKNRSLMVTVRSKANRTNRNVSPSLLLPLHHLPFKSHVHRQYEQTSATRK